MTKLDERDYGGSYKILLTTDKLVMRGFDFRAPLKGICLIIAKSFET